MTKLRIDWWGTLAGFCAGVLFWTAAVHVPEIAALFVVGVCGLVFWGLFQPPPPAAKEPERALVQCWCCDRLFYGASPSARCPECRVDSLVDLGSVQR